MKGKMNREKLVTIGQKSAVFAIAAIIVYLVLPKYDLVISPYNKFAKKTTSETTYTEIRTNIYRVNKITGKIEMLLVTGNWGDVQEIEKNRYRQFTE